MQPNAIFYNNYGEKDLSTYALSTILTANTKYNQKG